MGTSNLEELLNFEKEKNQNRIKKLRQENVFESTISPPLIASGVNFDGKYLLKPESDTFKEFFGDLEGIDYEEFIKHLTKEENLPQELKDKGKPVENKLVRIRDLNDPDIIHHFYLSCIFNGKFNSYQLVMNENFESELAEFNRNLSQILSDSKEYFYENSRMIEEKGKKLSKIADYVKNFQIFGKHNEELYWISDPAREGLEKICPFYNPRCVCNEFSQKNLEESKIFRCNDDLIQISPIIYKNQKSSVGKNKGMIRIKYDPSFISQLRRNPFLEDLTERIANTISPILENRERLTIDPLTELENSQQLVQNYNRLEAILRRNETPFSVTFMDIDDFKHINDTYGHDAGDHVLKYIGETIKNNIRPYDVAIRKGGDEFVFFLSGEDIQIPLNRIFDSLNDSKIEVNGQDITLNCSMGSVYISPENIRENNESLEFNYVLKRADDILYKSKEEGKKKLIVENL